MVFKYGDYEHCNRCGSKNIALVKRIFKNGAVNYQYQCLDCGDSSGSVKTETIPQEVIDNSRNIGHKAFPETVVAHVLPALFRGQFHHGGPLVCSHGPSVPSARRCRHCGQAKRTLTCDTGHKQS